ncbi:hypothetical protein [Streptomyces fuscigenes]|uniref:hypothetical protein n=1 Tax=Streptomyces fuscigenes TaxID=1528880 RepID=UPI001F38D05D|nr:hypothetical protein [Streptomyces fuscigenes]MCF3960340.1 hypothetical protein [Streptomyces fuscigenes]
MAPNLSHLNPPVAPVVALTDLLTSHPELSPETSGLTWSLTTSGVLHAEARDAADAGRAVDQCATVMRATPVRASVLAGTDRVVLAELAATWRGVPVEVWETYPAPEAPRPLGTVPLPGGRCA